MVNSSFPDHSFASSLKHSSGISLNWTPEEQAILDEGLVKYASETKLVIFYAKIANDLPNKTARDVALRVRFLNKKEYSKRKKDDHNHSRKSRDKKEKVSDPAVRSSHFAAQSNVSSHAPVTDKDDGLSYQSIGGPAADLLKQNAQLLSQISANLAAHQVQENIQLFCQTRDNINKLLNDFKEVPEAMKEMPPFHFNIDESIANSILPSPTFPKQNDASSV